MGAVRCERCNKVIGERPDWDVELWIVCAECHKKKAENKEEMAIEEVGDECGGD